MSQYWTVNDIVNQASVEVGLEPHVDVFDTSTTDSAVRQMIFLLNAAGRELVRMYSWRDLVGEFSILTDVATDDSGEFDLPDDFGYMIPQTNWDRDENVPWFGPLSAQDWTYLEGRNLVSSTIYASFRLRNEKVIVFPNGPDLPDGKTLTFEYIRDTWVTTNDGLAFQDEALAANDIVLFLPVLISRLLKVKFLEAKGFESSKVRDDFNEMLEAVTGQDKSAPVLNAGRWGRTFPYLDSWYNTPDSGFGV